MSVSCRIFRRSPLHRRRASPCMPSWPASLSRSLSGRSVGSRGLVREVSPRARADAYENEARLVLVFPNVEHQIENLVVWTQRGQERDLSPDTQSGDRSPKLRPDCDHAGVTGGDGCPTRTGDSAVDEQQWGREGSRRTGGNGWWLTTDLAVGVRIPLQRPRPLGCRPLRGRCRALRPSELPQPTARSGKRRSVVRGLGACTASCGPCLTR